MAVVKRLRIWLMHKLAGQCLDCVVCGGCMIDPPERHSYEECSEWLVDTNEYIGQPWMDEPEDEPDA